jgi:hypothetical protein
MVRRRLEQLEQLRTNLDRRDRVRQQIFGAALENLSDADLDVLQTFIERGAPFSNPTPEESTALEKLSVAAAVAALKVSGPPPLRATSSSTKQRASHRFRRSCRR